jgi:hypothetical protein
VTIKSTVNACTLPIIANGMCSLANDLDAGPLPDSGGTGGGP